jgi:hypothetical protein
MAILNKKYIDIKIKAEEKSKENDEASEQSKLNTSQSESVDTPETSFKDNTENLDAVVDLAVSMIESQMESEIRSKVPKTRFDAESIKESLQSRDINELFKMAADKINDYEEIENLYRLVYIQEPVLNVITKNNSSRTII